jgi:hypothetical protein
MSSQTSPSDDKIVLLCCVGRSGSTSLQRIVNTIPNSNICGENHAAILDLLRFYQNIKKTTFDQVVGGKRPVDYDLLIDKKVKPAWYNSYNYDEIVNMIKFLIMRMFKDKKETTLWGFKEIRYAGENINLIEEFKELFPQTKVVVLIRENVAQQAKSAWFKDDPNSINVIKKQSKNLVEFYKKHKDYVFFLTFERMFNKANIQDLFHFIGCGEHFDENKIIEVLTNKIETY